MKQTGIPLKEPTRGVYSFPHSLPITPASIWVCGLKHAPPPICLKMRGSQNQPKGGPLNCGSTSPVWPGYWYSFVVGSLKENKGEITHFGSSFCRLAGGGGGNVEKAWPRGWGVDGCLFCFSFLNSTRVLSYSFFQGCFWGQEITI